jgi:multidrug efflux pump subunit AcrA (membrane-fusion protein)
MATRKPAKQIASTQRHIVIQDRITGTSKTYYRRTKDFIKSRPLTAFLTVLGLLFLLIIAGSLLQKTPAEKKDQKLTKTVNIYSIGQGPQATFQAKVEKSGVVKIIAQSAGVVQRISVNEGDTVREGQQLVSLSTNYQGGNAQGVQREIAQTQYKNVLDTFGLQNDLINRQKDVATASAQQAQQTRDISRQALNDTNGLIDSNQSQLDQINQQLTTLRATDPTNPQIGTLQTTAGQLQASLAQLRASARTTDYQSANDKTPALLSNLQQDIAIKQLDVQQKGLSLNREVSGLQADLAAVAEGLMYPASPFAGTVERINIREGQLVNPGTELATVVSPDGKTTAILLVPLAIARTIYASEASTLLINGKEVSVIPTHIATEATDGQLYAVEYEIPKDQAFYLTDGEYLSIQVPIGAKPRVPGDPLIPIDAVYQTQESAYVLVVNQGKAETRTITLGNVYGSYVEALKGLNDSDQIILNRNVIANDKVVIK